jgi:hypothetical protein
MLEIEHMPASTKAQLLQQIGGTHTKKELMALLNHKQEGGNPFAKLAEAWRKRNAVQPVSYENPERLSLRSMYFNGSTVKPLFEILKSRPYLNLDLAQILVHYDDINRAYDIMKQNMQTLNEDISYEQLKALVTISDEFLRVITANISIAEDELANDEEFDHEFERSEDIRDLFIKLEMLKNLKGIPDVFTIFGISNIPLVVIQKLSSNALFDDLPHYIDLAKDTYVDIMKGKNKDARNELMIDKKKLIKTLNDRFQKICIDVITQTYEIIKAELAKIEADLDKLDESTPKVNELIHLYTQSVSVSESLSDSVSELNSDGESFNYDAFKELISLFNDLLQNVEKTQQPTPRQAWGDFSAPPTKAREHKVMPLQQPPKQSQGDPSAPPNQNQKEPDSVQPFHPQPGGPHPRSVWTDGRVKPGGGARKSQRKNGGKAPKAKPKK